MDYWLTICKYGLIKMSKINVKRPGTGLIKLEVQHQGTSDIRSNFRSSLLGTSGEKQRHIVEIREFAASISESCLTPSAQILFTVFGRHVGIDVLDEVPRGVTAKFNDAGHFHLGTTAKSVELAQRNLDNNAALIAQSQQDVNDNAVAVLDTTLAVNANANDIVVQQAIVAEGIGGAHGYTAEQIAQAQAELVILLAECICRMS